MGFMFVSFELKVQVIVCEFGVGLVPTWSNNGRDCGYGNFGITDAEDLTLESLSPSHHKSEIETANPGPKIQFVRFDKP